MALTFHIGPNLSGRSAALRTAAWGAGGERGGIYLNTSATANFSGFARTVGGERYLHDIAEFQPGPREAFARRLVADLPTDQRLLTLSGGQQVRLVLACALGKNPNALAIDGLLEQLDADTRSKLAERLPRYDCDLHMSDGYEEPFLTHASAIVEHRAPDGTASANKALASLAASLTGASVAAPTIELCDLKFRYARTKSIFSGTTFKFHPGRPYLLKAPNGAGKSTLARLLLGVERPTGGKVLVDGANHRAWASARNLLFYAFQNPHDQLFGTSVRSYLERFAKITANRQTFLQGALELEPAALLSGTGLDRFGDFEPFELPWFIAKRVSLIAALVSRSPWLFFDEPAIGSDAEGRAAIFSLVDVLARSGLGIIVVSHGNEFDNLPNATRITIRDGCLVSGEA